MNEMKYEQALIRILKKNFNHEVSNEIISCEKIVKTVLNEQNVSKRNEMLSFLLERKQKQLINAIWKNIPIDDDSYFSDEKLKVFIEKRKDILEDHASIGMNASDAFGFSDYSIVRLNTDQSNELLYAVQSERRSTIDWYDYEIENFKMSFKDFSKGPFCGSDSGLSFAIVSNDYDVMGYIGLDPMKTIGPLTSKYTYNLSYYMLPQYRGKGLMKAALKTFIKALFDSKICTYYSASRICSRKDDYFAEAKPLKIRLLIATAVTENIASIKLIESLNFEKSGTVKWARKIGEDESDEITDYDAEENIEICTSTFYTKVIV